MEKFQHISSILRGLILDAVYTAERGHMGMPLGFADIGVMLYGKHLRHNPKNSQFHDRSRLILSAGHGVLLQYGLFVLSGYPLSIDDLAKYRRFGSKTPSHPELAVTNGIDSSTGVDGQGIAHGVGQAFTLKVTRERLPEKSQDLLKSKIFVIAGDGCFMEGVAAESSSFAGHHCLNNLVVFYDANTTLKINEITQNNPLGREASHQALQDVANQVSSIIVGSADLARSDKTFIANEPSPVTTESAPKAPQEQVGSE